MASVGLALIDVMVSASAIASLFKGDGDVLPETAVTIAAGASPAGEDGNTGGSVPHVALFDQWGHRIGQNKGDEDAHVGPGQTYPYNIKHDQTEPRGDSSKQPEYALLSMQESDAICISYVSVAQGVVSWAWTGDWAYECGKQWYHSALKVGDANYQPKCAWLDTDGSNGISASGMSLHMPDFSTSEALANEYAENKATLCNSDARMRFWMPEVGGDTIPQFFDPPLRYKDDGSDLNPKRVINGYTFPEKHAKRPGGKSRRFQRHAPADRPGHTEHNDHYQPAPVFPNVTNPWPSHLNINYIKGLSAKELCDSETSFGPDFVAVDEGFFCDMSEKKLYPLCSDKVDNDCFNLDTKSLLQPRGMSPRSFTQRSYNTTREWHP